MISLELSASPGTPPNSPLGTCEMSAGNSLMWICCLDASGNRIGDTAISPRNQIMTLTNVDLKLAGLHVNEIHELIFVGRVADTCVYTEITLIPGTEKGAYYQNGILHFDQIVARWKSVHRNT